MREMLVIDSKAFDAFSRALFTAIDAALVGDLGEGCYALPEGPLEPSVHGANGMAELELLQGVDEAWIASMLHDLRCMDTETVHGKQI